MFDCTVHRTGISAGVLIDCVVLGQVHGLVSAVMSLHLLTPTFKQCGHLWVRGRDVACYTNQEIAKCAHPECQE